MGPHVDEEPREEPREAAKPDGADRPRDKALFAVLADSADAIATTIAASAELHDKLSGWHPDAAEHADRDRRLAEAERRAAECYRAGRLPDEETREIIRRAGAGRPEPT